MEKDYYRTLGVDKNASEADIKSAFRKLSKKYHPDVCKEKDAEERFKEINEAYSVLSDNEKRAMYDRFGTVDPNQMGGGFDPFDGMDPFEAFRSEFGFSSPFSGGFRTNTQQKEKGDDLKVTISLTLDEIYTGVHKKIKMNKKCSCHRCNGSGSQSNDTGECPHCHGTGYIQQTQMRGNTIIRNMTLCPHCHGAGNVIKDPCPNCHGTGLEEKSVDIEFDVPQGMFENAYFLVRGKGNDGPHRGVPGDLLVVVREKPNQYGLKRDEKNNLLYTAKVPYKTLVFGGDIEIPYICGEKKKIHINAGTESGKMLKLPNMGFPNPNMPTMKADYIITIQCYIPKTSELTKAEKNGIQSLTK